MYEGPIFVLRCERLNKRPYQDKQEGAVIFRPVCIPEREKGCALERLPVGSAHDTGRVVLIYRSLAIVFFGETHEIEMGFLTQVRTPIIKNTTRIRWIAV